MPRRGRSNTMARRYKGRPDTFRTDLAHRLVLNNAICTSNFCIARYILLLSRLINVDILREWIPLKY